MKKRVCFDGEGLKLSRATGRFVELYLDWERLPRLDLDEEYYLVEIIPESPLLPTLYARPTSEGPLFFCLEESVSYRLNLLSVPRLKYDIQSDLTPLPTVDLLFQSEGLLMLIWRNMDSYVTLSDNALTVRVDGKKQPDSALTQWPCHEVVGRPHRIDVSMGSERPLFSVITNLEQSKTQRSRSFTLEKTATRLCLSSIVSPEGGNWRVRAELTCSFGIRRLWKRFFIKKYPDTNPTNIVGICQFYTDGTLKSENRLFGYQVKIKRHYIDQIQIEEWKERHRSPVLEFKLQLRITSAHRELYRHVLLEKTYPGDTSKVTIGFSEREIEEAESRLYSTNPNVSWDQAFLELAVFFRSKGREFHEFQRDNAHCLTWEYPVEPDTEECSCRWVLFDLEKQDNRITVLKSGVERRVHWPSKVVLKPFSSSRLLAWWDLDRREVEERVKSRWHVDFREVGFYLKVHEEYLGGRVHRGDLDLQLVDLFSSYQNVYFDVEPDKCFSVEIVARHFQMEIALTPVSRHIVTPKMMTAERADGGCHREYQKSWYHSSQREVRHENGRDSENRAKILLHLHMHSPNLFRADPFREGYLKNSTWPTRAADGSEVHNPPGEWAMKNCLDCWLPLLRVFRTLAHQGVDYQISLDITPPVAYMLSSPRFKDYFSRYLLRVRGYIKSRICLMRARHDSPEYIYAAERNLADVESIDLFYNQELGKDVIGAFRELESKGFLELLTCTATHGLAGELESVPDSLNTQVVLAARSHHRIFGNRPNGIWLAENSIFPGVESYLEKESLNYFFVETEAILRGSTQPVEGEFNPVLIPNSEVVAFGRSQLGRRQIWDAEVGYAGHPNFREYHFRHYGLAIKRITAKTSDDKRPYNPDAGEKTARDLALDFYGKLNRKASELAGGEFRTIPLICCTYDAELFGHHWSEGPIFLDELLREIYRNGDSIGLTTPSHYLVDSDELPEVRPNPSTWGHEAVHVKWSDPEVAWVHREIERADGVLKEYLGAALRGELSEFQKKMVEQMAAELIRSQSSDLPFVIMAGDFKEDMRREIQKYFDYFYRLKNLIDNTIENEEFLCFRRYENDMFPEISEYYRIR